MSTQPNPYAPPAAVVSDVVSVGAGSAGLPFFAVSALKLAVMSVCTFGTYQIYWYYRQWKAVRGRTGEAIFPAARALFGVFFCYGLFCRVRDFRPDLPSAKLSAGMVATIWIVLNLSYRLPEPWFVVGFASFVPLLDVQRAINAINRDAAPGHDPNARFSAWNWVAVVFGALLLVLVVLGLVQKANG